MFAFWFLWLSRPLEKEAWSYGWRIHMRGLCDGREGLKHKRECDYRAELDLQTARLHEGQGFSACSPFAALTVPALRL